MGIFLRTGTWFFVLTNLLLPHHAAANTQSVAAICERAAIEAANETIVPLSVLRAISLTETGRKRGKALQPWPWTVNMEGVGKWFEDYDTARAYVERHFQRGARSFDVGCFQINYRWHHAAFDSIDHMFEPRANALYAARFLTELYEEFGDWSKAAGAYHSRTPKFARKYIARFDRIRANLEEPPPINLAKADAPIAPESQVTRVNTFPLLQRGAPGGLASLVPLERNPRSRLIDVTPVATVLER